MSDTRKTKLTEKDIENYVCVHAKSRGLAVYKFTSPNRRSVPDRIFFAPGGHTLFIEFKAPGKLPTTAQYREMGRLIELGFKVGVIDDPVFGKQFINDWLEEINAD